MYFLNWALAFCISLLFFGLNFIFFFISASLRSRQLRLLSQTYNGTLRIRDAKARRTAEEVDQGILAKEKTSRGVPRKC